MQRTNLDEMAQDFLGVSNTYSGTAPADPYPMLADLRENTPVMRGDILARFEVPSQADYAGSGRPVMTVFRYADVFAILRDPKNWKSSLNADGFGAAVDNLLLTAMDDDEHKKYRTLLAPAFTMPVVNRMRDTIVRPIIQREFSRRLQPKGRADLVLDYALPFPVRVVYALFGFPEDPDAVMQFASWALKILSGPQVDPAKAALSIPAAMKAGQQLFEHVLPIVQARRASGEDRDDLISFMMKVELDGKRFTDEEITGFVRMLLLAAAETTSRTFGNMMIMLLGHPETLEKVRADRSLIGKAIVESMRFDPVATNLARIAACDMEVCGVMVPAGTAVTVSIGAANRDPMAYERPNEFWLERPMKPALSFGFGPHICLGMHIARMEMEVALDELLNFSNLRFDPDHPRPVIRGMQMRGADAIHVLWDV